MKRLVPKSPYRCPQVMHTLSQSRERERPSSAGARRSKRLAAGRLARFPPRLTLLPPDILLLILEWVAIDLTSQWNFLPLSDVDRGRAIDLANESRRSLSRLARTCRCLYLPTMRRLLRSIYIYDGDSAARLLHFLFNRVEMRQHIHEVHVMDWLTINFGSSCRRALADIGWNFESLSPMELAVMGSTRSENLTAKTYQTRSTGFHGGRDRQAVGQALGPSLVVTILLFTTALRTLRLTVPDLLNDKTLLQMESQLALAQTTYGLRPLQGVSAMGFTEFPGTSEFFEVFGRDARPNPRWISLFTCQSESLRRLELGGGMLLDANETRTLSENEFPLRRLQHLRVSNVSLQDIRWLALCKGSPCLTEIHLCANDTALFKENWLADGLYATRATLKKLYIERARSSSILDGGSATALSCLPHLAQLRHLTIPASALFGVPQNMGNASRSLSQLLPRSLSSFCIKEQWFAGWDLKHISEYMGWKTYGASIAAVIRDICHGIPLSNLQHFTFHEQWRCWRVGTLAEGVLPAINSKTIFTALDVFGKEVAPCQRVEELTFDVEDEWLRAENIIRYGDEIAEKQFCHCPRCRADRRLLYMHLNEQRSFAHQ